MQDKQGQRGQYHRVVPGACRYHQEDAASPVANLFAAVAALRDALWQPVSGAVLPLTERVRMIDAPDVQHHLERGILLFSRGMVFEARDAWRKVLQLEPSNAIAMDYIESTEAELNDYDRHREAETARMQEEAPRRLPSLWEDVDVLSNAMDSGPEENLQSPSAASSSGEAATGWASVAEDDTGWEDSLDNDDWGGPAVEVASARGTQPGGSKVERTEPAPPQVAPTRAQVTPIEPTTMAESTDWEPLSWINEDTPAGPSTPPPVSKKSSRASSAKARPVPPPTEPEPSDLFSEDVSASEIPALSADDMVEAALTQARQAGKSGRWWEARELLRQQQRSEPDHRALALELEVVERELNAFLERKLGPSDGIPQPLGSMAELYELNLDSVSGYLLSLIDGVLTLEDIYTLASHIDQTTVMYRVSELLDRRAITLKSTSSRSPKPASRRR